MTISAIHRLRRTVKWRRVLFNASLPVLYLMVLHWLTDDAATRLTFGSFWMAVAGGLGFAIAQDIRTVREYKAHQDQMVEEYREFHEQLKVERATHQATLSKPA